jgi:hypothetical protein
MRLAGARAVADQGVAMVQSLEQDYQSSINTALIALGMDADGAYRLDLETGLITPTEAPAANGTAVPIAPAATN